MLFRCPRCSVGPLFQGILKLAPRCEACGLDFKPYDQGDGPAAFAVFFVGIIIVGAALLVEFNFHPPWWVHVLLWVPLTFGVTILILRVIKGWLVQQQYRHLPPQQPPATTPPQ